MRAGADTERVQAARAAQTGAQIVQNNAQTAQAPQNAAQAAPSDAYAENLARLRAYRVLLAEIARQTAEMERWYSIAERMTPALSGVRCASADGGRIETAVEHLDALRTGLAERLAALTARRRALEAAIDAVPDARQRLLLRYRYIDGLAFEAVAARMQLSVRRVLQLHRAAVIAVRAPDSTQ